MRSTSLANATPILSARLARGLSAKDVAARAGIDAGFLSRLEHGEREPSLTTLRALAAAIGCSIAELVGEWEAISA